jgi:hypothetical protein
LLGHEKEFLVEKFPWMPKYNHFSIQGNFLTNILHHQKPHTLRLDNDAQMSRFFAVVEEKH